MQNGITGIDHPVIAVADMEAARRIYERLGFTVPPRGSHIEWGTGNWCIMFAEDYLELRGIVDPARYTHNLDDFLATRGEGLMGLAFGTIGAQQSHDLMVENGLHPKPVRALTRNFELPDGWVQPRFSLCFPDEAEVPGLMHVVLCEHLTPELIRRPEFLEHANDVKRLRSMTGVMAAPHQAAAALRTFLGADRVRNEADGLVLDCGGQEIRLVPPADLARLHGGVAFDPIPQPPFLAALVLEVGDLDKTRRALEANDVAFVAADAATLRVGPKETCGVIIDFMSVP